MADIDAWDADTYFVLYSEWGTTAGESPDGKTWGLSVANTRSNLAWNFTPLKAIEKDRVVFENPEGTLRIQYFLKPGDVIGAKVERTGAATAEYSFEPVR